MQIPIGTLDHSVFVFRKDEERQRSLGADATADGIAAWIKETEKAIALLKAHEGQCQCGMVEPGFNAALHDLGHSLTVHRDFLKAYEGTPKGDYHARCIADLEAALAKLQS